MQHLEVMPYGTWCLMGWESTHTDSGWHRGCSCDRAAGHQGRHRCTCGRTRLQRDDDPQWTDEDLDEAGL